MKVNVLGTEYTITVKKYDEEEAFERRSIDGYCDGLTKNIVVCDMATYKGWEHELPETVEAAQKQTLRHEIVHAFFYESGLGDSAFNVDCAWSENEEMVDWFALQGPKIYKAWQDAGALPPVSEGVEMMLNIPTLSAVSINAISSENSERQTRQNLMGEALPICSRTS